jgi:hypothetical protein
VPVRSEPSLWATARVAWAGHGWRKPEESLSEAIKIGSVLKKLKSKKAKAEAATSFSDLVGKIDAAGKAHPAYKKPP